MILVYALNPSMTDSLASSLYGREELGGNPDNGPGEGDGLNENTGRDDIQGEVSAITPETGGITDGNNTEGLNADNTAYVVPENSVVTLPDQVNGRAGYEPIKEEKQEVADTEADSLKDTLETGDTGENLTFDTDIYPYYGMLDQNMQRLYRQIYANAVKGTVSFAPVINVNVNQLVNVFEAVYNDHPELFWVETGYSCKYMKNGRCVEISLRYYPVTNNLEAAKNMFETQAQNILSGARELEGDYAKEKYVHDALISRVEYDTGADMNQSAYSALVNGRSVCAGYARAYQYLMQQLEIPCYYCTGYSGEDHAWNIVKLSDGYYNLDATWDDTDPATYNYFNKSDRDLAGTHVRKGLSVYLPACGGGTYSDREKNAPEQVELPEITEPIASTKPMEPLTWQGESDKDSSTPEALRKAGITKDEVLESIDEYYEDCLDQMKKEGSGDRQFVNVVPEFLWIVVEREYMEGAYQKGYVEEALKELKMDHFAIQLQAQHLGDGYYRLYHNVVTWNDEE